jgi:Response regulator containing CheY-like receiver domain and AraC-type DNA-binding domain
MTRVLVVDDEPQILRALRINLRVRNYEVHVAATGAEALEVAGRYPSRPGDPRPRPARVWTAWR